MKKFIIAIIFLLLNFINVNSQINKWDYTYPCKPNTNIYSGNKEYVKLFYGHINIEHYQNESYSTISELISINPFSNKVKLNLNFPYLEEVVSVDDPNDHRFVLSYDPRGVPLKNYELDLFNQSKTIFTFIHSNKNEKYLFNYNDELTIPINEFISANKLVVEFLNKLDNKTYKEEISLIGFTKCYNNLMKIIK